MQMVLDLVLDEEFFASLTQLDAEIAQQVAAGGCRWCGGPLHQANYQRKPRGGLLAQAGEGFAIRHSLCCGAEGCRKRSLPPSLRFLGRRVYLEVVVLLASMAAQLAATIREACMATGVPSWTLQRWSVWWREAFVQGPTWASYVHGSRHRRQWKPTYRDRWSYGSKRSYGVAAHRASRMCAGWRRDFWPQRPARRCQMDRVL